MATKLNPDVRYISESAIAETGRGTLARVVGLPHLEGVSKLNWAESTEASPFPREVTLAFLRDGRLRVREPLQVNITDEDGQIVAEVEELDEFGFGDNETEAIADLQHSIAELYFTLEEEQERLGRSLLQTWEKLRVKVERR